MVKNLKFSKFTIFSLINLKIENFKIPKNDFLIFISRPPHHHHHVQFWSSWDNLDPSYVQKRVFNVCPPKGEGGRISQNPILVGIRDLKSICIPKFVNQSSIESSGLFWLSEWVRGSTHTYKWWSMEEIRWKMALYICIHTYERN